MQDHPAAPGSARQRNSGTDGPAACGGAAVPAPQAWDHVRSHAVPLHLPLALAHVRAGAVSLPLAPHGPVSLPLAPAHVRAGAASLPSAPPGQPGPASANQSVLRSTDLSPAYLSRRLQAVLCHIAATPRHPDCPLAHRLNRHSHTSTSVLCYGAGIPVPPSQRGDHRGPTHRQPADPDPSPIACILPSRYRAARRRPPRARAIPHQHLSRAPPPPTRRKPTLLRGHRNVSQ